MKTQLEKIEKCMEAIDEIRDFFTDPNIDAYLIGSEEGLHLAKVEIEKKARESKIAIDLEKEYPIKLIQDNWRVGFHINGVFVAGEGHSKGWVKKSEKRATLGSIIEAIPELKEMYEAYLERKGESNA